MLKSYGCINCKKWTTYTLCYPCITNDELFISESTIKKEYRWSNEQIQQLNRHLKKYGISGRQKKFLLKQFQQYAKTILPMGDKVVCDEDDTDILENSIKLMVHDLLLKRGIYLDGYEQDIKKLILEKIDICVSKYIGQQVFEISVMIVEEIKRFIEGDMKRALREAKLELLLNSYPKKYMGYLKDSINYVKYLHGNCLYDEVKRAFDQYVQNDIDKQARAIKLTSLVYSYPKIYRSHLMKMAHYHLYAAGSCLFDDVKLAFDNFVLYEEEKDKRMKEYDMLIKGQFKGMAFSIAMDHPARKNYVEKGGDIMDYIALVITEINAQKEAIAKKDRMQHLRDELNRRGFKPHDYHYNLDYSRYIKHGGDFDKVLNGLLEDLDYFEDKN